MSESPTNPAIALTGRLEELHQLDAPAGLLAQALHAVIPPGPVKDLLSGRPLGHALHPLLTDVPIGAWTSALFLDFAGGRGSAGAADRLIALGVVAALPTAVSGWSDWSDAPIRDRRVGLVHAAANIGALGLFSGSLRARRNGRRGRGKAMSLAAAGALSLGGYLGGHLAYARGVAVEDRAAEPAPTASAEPAAPGAAEPAPAA